ncbi:MAG: sigma-70 family RNA polymerase sigma factor [Deferribacteres bacterium]|nr:sigma-70 family RNA polymerase sigma factor [candidate division KSB1 bacterium]MCB9511917.1 sigma-70 family RNA polymerase sigma factor [Deferribacteres bacterium]
MTRTENEAALVAQASDGDIDAFRELFERYQSPVFHFITKMVGQPEDAEDITQIVFVRVHRKLASLRDKQAFAKWLFTTARNESINHLRRKNAKQAASLEAMQENKMPVEPKNADHHTYNPEQMAAHRDMDDIVQQALNDIPEINRSAFVLGVLEGYSYKEVGAMLGCSVNNVKLRVFRARALLSEKLRPYFGR